MDFWLFVLCKAVALRLSSLPCCSDNLRLSHTRRVSAAAYEPGGCSYTQTHLCDP
jgi:hypothetical protein